MAVANYATGNNIYGVKGRSGNGWGSNLSFLSTLCDFYGLTLTSPESLDEVIAALKARDCMAVVCVINNSPFTTTSHYMVIAGVDDKYVYFIDPLPRDDYGEAQKQGDLQIVSPGVVRVLIEKAQRYTYSPTYLITKGA